MSEASNPSTTRNLEIHDSENPADSHDLHLMRSEEYWRDKFARLEAENLSLRKSLTLAESNCSADRDLRLAALNLMEDAVEAQLVAQRENIERCRVEAELRNASRLKDEFLATLAHELRNPLAPIRNSLELLRITRSTQDVDEEQIHEMLQRQVNHLIRLVDDLMEISRITRGQIVLRKQPIALKDVVQAAIELSRPQIDLAHHQLTLDLPDEDYLLFADATRITQVLANLLNNAAKYTCDGGQILVTAQPDNVGVAVSIKDNGLGIPHEMLPRVFDLFTQVDRTLGRAQGGLGIGLALVRKLVDLHGGSVEARSEGADRGSEFVIRLPLAQPDVNLPGPSTAKPFSAADIGRILVVDDNRDAAETLALVLRVEGLETYTAHSGRAALDCLEDLHPSIVILDIGMPEMDGNEVAQQIRKEPKFDEISLIALTGWSQVEDRRRCKKAGFDHHLVKPVAIDELENVLVAIAKSRGQSLLD